MPVRSFATTTGGDFFSRPAFHLEQSAILSQAAWLLSALPILLTAITSLSNQRSLYIFLNTRDGTRTNKTNLYL